MHQDSIGTKETLGKGSIQFMTAGVFFFSSLLLSSLE